MYKVEFIKTEINNNQISPKSMCIFTISMDVDAYKRAKLSSILRLINKNFQQCTIVIGDLLHRHNYVFEAGYSFEEYEDVCCKKYLDWFKNHLSPCLHELEIPFKVVRWNYFITHPKFEEYLEKIEMLYVTDELCKQAFDDSAKEFLDRRKRQLGANFHVTDDMIRASINYLKEEAAAFCIFPEFNCEYEIYYNKRTFVMQYIYNTLLKPQYPHLLQLLTLRYKKFKNKIDINESSETWTLKSLLEILPGHIYWKNKDGIYLGCNQDQAEYYGLKSIHEILNKTDFDILPPKIASKVRANDLSIMKNSSTRTLIEKNKKDYFLSIKSSIKDDRGEIVGIVGCSVNITKQKVLEQKLKMQTSILSEAIKTKEYFLNNLSHEIRTPVHVITSIADEMATQHYALSDEEKLEFIKLLQTTSHRMSKLIKSILTVAKAKKGTLSLRMEQVNITDLVKDIVSELSVISVAPITIHAVDIVYVHCTRYQIEQVVRNLVENAIKYGNNNPIDVTITSDATHLTLEIKDQGVGVPKDEVVQIFEAFAESSRTKSSSGGVGLGLAICKDIIKLHKGQIWVDPESVIGSKFIFTLPINQKIEERKNDKKS